MLLIATAAPGSPCAANEYQCVADDQCIPVSYHCDGEMDCQDESDERGCCESSQPNNYNIVYCVIYSPVHHWHQTMSFSKSPAV